MREIILKYDLKKQVSINKLSSHCLCPHSWFCLPRCI